MQSGADKLLESMSDQELVYYPAEENLATDEHFAEERQEAGYRHNHSTAEEDTVRQHHNQNKHKLTIDITSAPSPARTAGIATRSDYHHHQQQPLKSPSANSTNAASSPRMLYPDTTLRSPGVAPPVSPRHASRAPS